MYKREFDVFLNSKKPFKSIFFHGLCPYQNNLYAQKTLQSINAKNEEKLLLHFDDYDFSSAKSFLSQSSLFEDRNILVIKTDKTIPSKELSVLIELCHKNDSSYMLYQYFGDEKKAKIIANAFVAKSSAFFVRFFKPEHNEAMALLLEKAQIMGLKIDQPSLHRLYLAHSEDIALCANEFEKLAILDKNITPLDIDKMVYGLGNVSLEEFIEKIFKKDDLRDIFTKVIDEQGDNEVEIINALSIYVSQLFLFNAYIRLNGQLDAQKILGYSPPANVINQKLQLSKKIDLKTYKNLFHTLMDTEFKLKKSSFLDKNAFLLSSLIKFQSYL
ncbi:MAG: DNA polymerase III subunit delta [Sulfurospirillaceae bacterium]|nr:DNA polymerase III subunit delta [Sulfurospirillaceae bacterium]